jgi:hypothetical protein
MDEWTHFVYSSRFSFAQEITKPDYAAIEAELKAALEQ